MVFERKVVEELSSAIRHGPPLLLNQLPRESFHVSYWRDGPQEVDFVVTGAKEIWALEVKSGRPGRTSGLKAFRQRYPAAPGLVIGSGGIPLDEFFARPASVWFGQTAG